MKNPLTPAGIGPVTLRFVTQHLNYCATAGPHKDNGGGGNDDDDDDTTV